MNMTLAIFAGGGIGAVLRHALLVAQGRLMGPAFPYGTLAVNVPGCLLAGALVEYLAVKGQASPEMRAFLTVGILGGFTIFSTFSVEVLKLAETGHSAAAAVYALASLVFSIAAAFSGLYLMRGVLG